MTPDSDRSLTNRLAEITRRWWFYVAVALLFFLPPLAQRGFSTKAWSAIVSSTLANAWADDFTAFQPYIHVLVVLLLVSALVRPQSWMRIFNLYVALSYIAFAILQNTAQTPRFGFAVVTSNFIWFILVGLAWLVESASPTARYARPRFYWWHAWAVPLAFIAFWGPPEPWAFSLRNFFYSFSPFAFCLMTPAYLCVHCAFYPTASPLVLRVTGFVGALIGCINMSFAFSSGNTYSGTMHIPLLLVSLLALVLAQRQSRAQRPPDAAGSAALPDQPAGPTESSPIPSVGTDASVVVSGLRKSYGKRPAVDGASFSAAPGEILGLLGPNGAGKTTTVECIAGLRRPDAGHISVLGLNPTTQPPALRKRLGIQLQKEALPENLTVGEALYYFQRFHSNAINGRPLLEQLDLSAAEGKHYAKLSGGQKQRLHFLLALLGDPDVLIVDEPTTGLDPCARRVVWEMIRTLKDRGKTILITTHFMDEAETLCDRVAFLCNGRIVAQDTPAKLIDRLGWSTRISFKTAAPLDAAALRSVEGVVDIRTDNSRVSVYASAPSVLNVIMTRLQQAGAVPEDLHTSSATLEDVFLLLAGAGAFDGGLLRADTPEQEPAPDAARSVHR